MLFGLLFAPVLWVFGFGAAGVVEGSLAAWFQAAVYGCCVPAGGLFALMQSWGAAMWALSF